MRTSSQRGSVHGIVIVVLVVGLLGALGVVFYQNFIAKKTEQQVPVTNNEPAKDTATKTQRVAYASTIYALDYPESWSAATERAPNNPNASTTTITNPDGSVRIKVDVGMAGLGGTCDTANARKIRYYNVSSQAVTKLGDVKAYMVETIIDAQSGGYVYTVGLTQDGGNTHAAVGDPHCTVGFVGAALQAAEARDGKPAQPTISALIDFPKLSDDKANDRHIKEMQVVKDVFASSDYKAAVTALESMRRE